MLDPTHYARWVRKVHSMENDAPINVDQLAEKCGIAVHEDSIQGFLGLWFQVRDREGIILAEGLTRRRRRFTLAHELGHACLPAHRNSRALKCLDRDLTEADVDRGPETEANAFAAELLAPRRLVVPMLSNGALSIRKGSQIADRFDVSLSCAVRRIVELGRQPTAMVLAEAGSVLWCVRRHGFPFGLPSSGEPVPPDTITADIGAGRDGSADPQAVDPAVWLPTARKRFTLLESAVPLGSTQQVLSLLWIPDFDDDPEDEY